MAIRKRAYVYEYKQKKLVNKCSLIEDSKNKANQPLPTSCPLIRTLKPCSSSDPKARASQVDQSKSVPLCIRSILFLT